MEQQGNIQREFGTNYTCIPCDILHDERISLKARGLYATCMGFPKDWQLSVKGLQSILKEGRDAIYASLKELRKYGYLSVQQANNGRFGGVIYTLHSTSDSKPETCFTHTEKPKAEQKPLTENPYAENTEPITEKPYTENPNTEYPHTENPTQYNNIKNIENNNIEYNNIKENITKEKSSEKTKKSLEERQKDFYMTIEPYVEKYGSEMCRAFYDYWIEPFVNKPDKMKFEDCKTWSIAGRLATWHRNNYSNNTRYGRYNNNNQAEQRSEQTNARRQELMRIISANQTVNRENIEEVPNILDI